MVVQIGEKHLSALRCHYAQNKLTVQLHVKVSVYRCSKPVDPNIKSFVLQKRTCGNHLKTFFVYFIVTTYCDSFIKVGLIDR